MPETHTQDPFQSLARWKKIVFSVLALLVSIRSAWLDGLGTWEWSLPLIMVSLLFVPRPLGALGRGLSWPLRFGFLLWVGVLVIWAERSIGWLPAACIAAIWLIGTQQRGPDEPWEVYLRKPSALASTLIFVLFFALLWSENDRWVPTVCAGGPFLLLAIEPTGRRSLNDNVWRIFTILWAGLALTATFWIYQQPSFGRALILLMIVILWFGNLLLHLSSGERPLALSHPQS